MKDNQRVHTCLLYSLVRRVLFCLILSIFLYPIAMAAAQEPPQGIAPKEPLPADAEVDQDLLHRIYDRTNFIFNLDASFNYSDESSSGESLSGGGLNGQLGIGSGLTDSTTFLLLYTGYYDKSLDFYSDLVGPRARTEYQAHTITPMLKFDFGQNNRYSLMPSLFYTATYNKDVEGGGWEDGLYNYKDKGVSLDYKATGLGFGGKDGDLRLGIQYYDREYPNYTSLLDLATGNGIEEDEKDYYGTLARIGYKWGANLGFSWNADFYLLYKDLKDKKVVDSDGVLTDEGQKDYMNNLDLWLWFVPDTQPGLRLGVGLNGNWYRSNQNYYDGLGTITITDDVFMADYYDFDSYGVRPSVSYLLPMMPLNITFSYAYQKTDYLGRLAQDSNGDYKDEKQDETQDNVRLRLYYDLSDLLNIPRGRQIGIYGEYNYLKVRSNNDNETVYKYNHELNKYIAGLSFRY